MQVFDQPAFRWDLDKFNLRYGLNTNNDYYINVEGKLVVLKPIPDDPPIFEAFDTYEPVPTNLRIHHWPELGGFVGITKLNKAETNGSHHECYYIIADDEAALVGPFMTKLNIEVGQPAYLKNKKTIVFWDGSTWAKPK